MERDMTAFGRKGSQDGYAIVRLKSNPWLSSHACSPPAVESQRIDVEGDNHLVSWDSKGRGRG